MVGVYPSLLFAHKRTGGFGATVINRGRRGSGARLGVRLTLWLGLLSEQSAQGVGDARCRGMAQGFSGSEPFRVYRSAFRRGCDLSFWGVNGVPFSLGLLHHKASS